MPASEIAVWQSSRTVFLLWSVAAIFCQKCIDNICARRACSPDEVLMTANLVREIFEFGPYRLEAGLGLTRGGAYVALAPKELGMLEALVKREGGVVTKEELANEVWPNQSPSDDSLTRTVYALRKALAGGCESFIETVHRRGYRLVAPVSRVRNPSPQRSIIAKSVETAPAAYAAYLEGRQLANRDLPSDIERAIDYFELALKIDPGYAVALGAIAECRIYQAIRRYIAPRDAEVGARRACERALAIDADLISARAALGWIEGVIAWNDDAAMAALDAALALDPGYARGYYYRGWILRSMGRYEAALQDLFRACTLNPYAISQHGALAYSLFCAGRANGALDHASEMVKLMPTQAPGYNSARNDGRG